MDVKLRGLETNAGFLKDARINFHEGLTCIIGARGTCKSTIVETLRFVFDCDPGRVNQLVAAAATDDAEGRGHRGMLTATLGSGGLAKCHVHRTDCERSDTLLVERQIESNPRIFQDGIQELADTSVLHCVEIYSQGDLQSIAQNESRRLELIDRPNKREIAQLVDKREQFADELAALGPNIRSKVAEIETRRSNVRSLDPYRVQLAQLQSSRPQLSSELDGARELFLRRKSIVEDTAQSLKKRHDFMAALRLVIGSAGDIKPPPAAMSEIEQDSAELINSEFGRLFHFIDELRGEIDRDVNDELQRALTILKDECDTLNSKYFVLRQEQHEVNECLKQEDTLKQQIAHLERLQQELEGFTAELGLLKERRRELRQGIAGIDDNIYARRCGQVDEINALHGETILLTLHQGAASKEYADKLAQLLQGSRLRGQDEVAQDLAERVKPADLVDIVEAGDVSRLAELLERDAGQVTRLIAFLSDRPELYRLECIPFPDRLEITMYHQNVAKPVHELSKGQMATALLPLILRPAPYPLIFDQPEDDLDNSFIYQTLVRQIKKLKEVRQLIFVTHNANIPVLGEADLVVVMEMQNPRAAKKPLCDTVDGAKGEILSLLEGGAEAFNRRRQKYEGLLEEASLHGMEA